VTIKEGPPYASRVANESAGGAYREATGRGNYLVQREFPEGESAEGTPKGGSVMNQKISLGFISKSTRPLQGSG